VYKLLSLDVHNNLAALGDRHIVSQGEARTVALFGEEALRSVPLRLSLATGYLLQSAEMVHCAFRTEITVVRHLLEDFDRARKAMPQPTLG
jgi:hypothetical protein